MSLSGFASAAVICCYVLAFDRGHLGTAMAAVAGMGVGLVMIHGGRLTLGTALSQVVAVLTVAAHVARYGTDSGAQLLFVLVGIATLACFSTWRQRWVAFAWNVAVAVPAMGGHLDGAFRYFTGAEVGVDAAHEHAFFTLLVFGAVYIISDDLLRINRRFRVRSRAAVDRIGARSRQLSEDLQRLGRQSEDLRLANVALSEELARGERVRRELNVSREQLEQFVYAASHDLKEPLRSISSFVQLIRRRVSQHGDTELDEYTDIVLASASGMTQLLDGLLRYSRAGAEAAEPEALDLHREALLASHQLSKYATERGGEVKVLDGLGTGHVSRAALRAILQEVIHNALKFTAAGEAPRVEIGPCPRSGAACVAVRDYGIGIEPDFRERVFLLFQRLNRVDEYEGAGIGLALSRKHAAASGIHIEIATPSAGPGTVFLLHCPAARNGDQA